MRLSFRLFLTLLLPLALVHCGEPDEPGPVDPTPGETRDGGGGGGTDAGTDGGTTGTAEFTVGGSVTGLKGSGLVLQNAGESIAVSADGAFTFKKAATGSAYAVTVGTQPSSPTQVCTVTNGSGTLSANVTNVAVTCVTQSFKVGVTVTGLSGTGLQLKNNAEVLDVAGNGAIQFPTAVASGGTYAVSVARQPSSPAQTCSVSGGTGTVGGGDVTTITVNCSTSAFTLGGTVSGLTGGTLVLSNGASEAMVTASGTYSFPGTLASGTAYDVKVKTQPAGQTCTVANGTGTVGSANVTNVNVTCGARAHAVNANVTGLVGSVTLRNNGGNDLVVTASGTRAFSTLVAEGQTYLVTVFAQPATQTCTSEQTTARTMGTEDVTVNVTCVTNSYTVGGTISGLAAGETVELANGADSDSFENGPFTFFTPVNQGDTYSVTVAAQPVGKQCSVTNGSGTMGGANVTNVTVTCSSNSYTVGGSVSGLGTGKTVTLRNNGADELAVTSNGAFTFATKVAEGGSYTVTISAQPAGQTCTVTNGTGSGISANVTNVTVTCTTSYTVGGTVSGLTSGKTLVLTNNGEDVSVSGTAGGNPSFTFATGLSSGAAYAVTVKTQPAELTCTVANGTGTIASANVTNVAVTCVVKTYTVGGTVNGLPTGKTLVLTNNGGNDLSIAGTASGNTSFTFTTGLANGAAYTVAVKTQPSNYTCSVSKGSGTVASANVTDVSVFCTENRYSVGGTATGLTAGKTLVLTNNGGDDLTVSGASGNVPFTFATSLTTGSAYAVVVKTQPSGLTCTVTNGSGTVGTSNVTNVAVACVAPAAKVSVLRLGDGTGTIAGNATKVFIDTYEVPSGTLSSSHAVTGLTINGTATSEGVLSRSSDGRYLALAGYNATAGGATSSAGRVVGKMNSSGVFSVAATLTGVFGSNIRSAATVDGSAFWLAGNGSGANGGIHYVVDGATTSTQVFSTIANTRVVGVFGGQLYMSTASGTSKPVVTIGTGLPTTSGQTAATLNGVPSDFSSPYGFFFMDRNASVPGDDTLYVADDSATGGVFKFVKDASNTWSAATLPTPGAARSVAAVMDGTTVRLVATLSSSANTLMTIADDGSSTTWTTLATPATNTVLRGVAPAPTP